MGFFDDIRSGFSAFAGGVIDLGRRTAGAILREAPAVAAQVLINKIQERAGRGQQTGRAPIGPTPIGVPALPPGIAGPVQTVEQIVGRRGIISTQDALARQRFPVAPSVSIPLAAPLAVAGRVLGQVAGQAIGSGFCSLFPNAPFCGPIEQEAAMAVLPGGAIPQLGAGGGGIAGLISMSPFAVGPSGGLRPRRILQFTHPITGRIVWYRNMGRPILWSGDLSSTARVNRVAARAKRTRRAKTVRRRR